MIVSPEIVWPKPSKVPLKDDARDFKWLSSLQEVDLKSDFDYFVNPLNHIKFGFSIENHKYSPGKIEPRDSASLTKSFELDRQKSVESAIYISNEQKIVSLKKNLCSTLAKAK